MYQNAQTRHILVASTDHKDCATVRGFFECKGFAVECCTSLRDVYMADLSQYSLIMLEMSESIDMVVHTIQSIKLNRQLSATPVLVFSTSMKTEDIVDALNAGADDYVLKPFSERELTARVNAVLRSMSRVV